MLSAYETTWTSVPKILPNDSPGECMSGAISLTQIHAVAPQLLPTPRSLTPGVLKLHNPLVHQAEEGVALGLGSIPAKQGESTRATAAVKAMPAVGVRCGTRAYFAPAIAPCFSLMLSHVGTSWWCAPSLR